MRQNKRAQLGVGNNTHGTEDHVGSGDEMLGDQGKAEVHRYSSFTIAKAVSSMLKESGLDEVTDNSNQDVPISKKKSNKKQKKAKSKIKGTMNIDTTISNGKVSHNMVPFNYDSPTTTPRLNFIDKPAGKLIVFDDDQTTKPVISKENLQSSTKIIKKKVKKNSGATKKVNLNVNISSNGNVVMNRRKRILEQFKIQSESITDSQTFTQSRKKRRSQQFSQLVKATTTTAEMSDLNSAKKIKLSDLDVSTTTSLVVVDEIEVEESRDVEGDCINPMYTDKSFKKKLKNIWTGKTFVESDLLGEDGRIVKSPFQCCHLPQFVNSHTDLLARLSKQLRKLPMQEKNNDMYKFHQSCELPLTGACGDLRNLLLGPVRMWLSKLTGIALNDTLALSASLYKHTDTLLCHDDELEGRRIAFMLYLTEENWQTKHGGSLDLFSVDDAGNPDRVVERLYPQHNSFAFFEVSPVSYHQVSEVLTRDRVRLSVSGWFHGPDIIRPVRALPPAKQFGGPGDVDEALLYSWISPLFLAESTQASVRKQFQRDSEIQLDTFIPEEKYTLLCEQLQHLNTWSWAGPPNRVHYQVCPHTQLPPLVAEFLKVMRSEAIMLVMSQLTGLPLHLLYKDDDSSENKEDDDVASENESDDDRNNEEDSDDGDDGPVLLKTLVKQHHGQMAQLEPLPNKKNKTPKCSLQEPWVTDTGLPSEGTKTGIEGCGRVYSSVRRLSHGCYSLVLDDDNSTQQPDKTKKGSTTKEHTNTDATTKEHSSAFVLDVAMFCNVSAEDGWTEGCGGEITYVAKGEKKELLTVTPRANSLALVYRDAETFGFTKHVNASAKTDCYHAIVCQYK